MQINRSGIPRREYEVCWLRYFMSNACECHVASGRELTVRCGCFNIVTSIAEANAKVKETLENHETGFLGTFISSAPNDELESKIRAARQTLEGSSMRGSGSTGSFTEHPGSMMVRAA